MKPLYTPRQGQFLAFIHHYTTLHGRPPAEVGMTDFFQVTPPSVHQMILTLERRGFISRTPGQARSIRLRIPPEELPPLHGTTTPTSIPSRARQADAQHPTDTEAALLRLGIIQLEEWFAHNHREPLDDSKFIPLLDLLIQSFAHAGLAAPLVQRLRHRACELYHRICQEAVPDSTFEANTELMLNHLPASQATPWRR